MDNDSQKTYTFSYYFENQEAMDDQERMIDAWGEENDLRINISNRSVYEDYDPDDPDFEYADRILINGTIFYELKNEVDAMAFKLRWDAGYTCEQNAILQEEKHNKWFAERAARDESR